MSVNNLLKGLAAKLRGGNGFIQSFPKGAQLAKELQNGTRRACPSNEHIPKAAGQAVLRFYAKGDSLLLHQSLQLLVFR